MRWWWLPALLAVLANSRNRWVVEWGVVPETLAQFAMAVAAALLGLALLRQPIAWHIWPVGRWGYWFYPGHLAALYLLRF
ncbi:TraX family protein [Pseudomonas sp. OTU5201]|uniref:TraX family protein n=1 Tax=Pseudomonas sp. OTU5201 TaxID=3043850 RepID=UPI00313E3410